MEQIIRALRRRWNFTFFPIQSEAQHRRIHYRWIHEEYPPEEEWIDQPLECYYLGLRCLTLSQWDRAKFALSQAHALAYSLGENYALIEADPDRLRSFYLQGTYRFYSNSYLALAAISLGEERTQYLQAALQLGSPEAAEALGRSDEIITQLRIRQVLWQKAQANLKNPKETLWLVRRAHQLGWPEGAKKIGWEYFQGGIEFTPENVAILENSGQIYSQRLLYALGQYYQFEAKNYPLMLSTYRQCYTRKGEIRFHLLYHYQMVAGDTEYLVNECQKYNNANDLLELYRIAREKEYTLNFLTQSEFRGLPISLLKVAHRQPNLRLKCLLYERAVTLGYVEAYQHLVNLDSGRAKSWAKAGWQLGNKYCAAWLYQLVEKKYEEKTSPARFRKLKAYARVGQSGTYHSLMNNLGVCYEHQGKISKAINCFRQAAQDGCGSAYANLGAYYYRTQNYSAAVEHLKKACQWNIPMAHKVLGRYYLSRDFSQAEHHFRMAHRLGDPDAIATLAQDMHGIRPPEEILALLLEYYHSSTRSISLVHQLALHFYRTKEYERAEQYFLECSQAGLGIASRNLSILYREVSKNYPQMKKYAWLAIEQGEEGGLQVLQRHYSRSGEWEGFLLALKYGLTSLQKSYREMIAAHPHSPEMRQTIMQMPNRSLSSLGVQIKQKYLQKLKRYYLDRPTYFRHRCVRDILNLIFDHLEHSHDHLT